MRARTGTAAESHGWRAGVRHGAALWWRFGTGRCHRRHGRQRPTVAARGSSRRPLGSSTISWDGRCAASRGILTTTRHQLCPTRAKRPFSCWCYMCGPGELVDQKGPMVARSATRAIQNSIIGQAAQEWHFVQLFQIISFVSGEWTVSEWKPSVILQDVHAVTYFSASCGRKTTQRGLVHARTQSGQITPVADIEKLSKMLHTWAVLHFF